MLQDGGRDTVRVGLATHSLCTFEGQEVSGEVITYMRNRLGCVFFRYFWKNITVGAFER